MMNFAQKKALPERTIKNKELYEKCFTIRKKGLSLVAPTLPSDILVIATENVNKLTDKISIMIFNIKKMKTEEFYENYVSENSHKLIRVINTEWDALLKQTGRDIQELVNQKELEKSFLAEIVDMSNTEDVLDAYSSLRAKFEVAKKLHKDKGLAVVSTPDFFNNFQSNLKEKVKRRENDESDDIEDQLDEAYMSLSVVEPFENKVA